MPSRVPRADEAVVPEDKLARYALDPDHPRGRHKARVFSAALGIERADWRYLRDQLIDSLADAPTLGTRVTPFGVLYETLVLIDGLNGHYCAGRGNLDGPQPPRLVSTWVDIP